MALLLTYFCSTSSRKKTVSFLSCLMPRVYPAHKPLQANISASKMALDVYETQEGTYAGTCCRRTTRTSTRRGHHRPPARASREVGPPRSTARIKRRSTHRRDGLAEISSKIALPQRGPCCHRVHSRPGDPAGPPQELDRVVAPDLHVRLSHSGVR